MRICFDTNVVIDIFTRASDYSSSVFAYDIANIREFETIMPVSTITDIAYIIKKCGLNEETSKDVLGNLQDMFDVYDVLSMDYVKALKSPMKDFEDAFLSESAKRNGADLILTRDKKDFIESEVPFISPEDFVERFRPPNYAYDLIDG